MTTRNKRPLLVAFLCALFLFSAVAASAQCANAPRPVVNDPLDMLVVGDSIMWGQGLQRERKFWWRIKCWLQEKTGREVRGKVEAHSGASIETAGNELLYSSNGEVPSFTPTVNQQVTVARQHYADPGAVDLVLVNGCINDVDVRNLLNAATKLEPLEAGIKEACGGRMQRLLVRTAREFPNAHLIVTGYYNIFSDETDHNRFTRMLVKNLTSRIRDEETMSDKEMRRRLVAISDLWYRVSTDSLDNAVNAANSELGNPRIHFAEIDFDPEHAFAAPETLLWNFKFASTNLTGLRQAIVIITLGTAAYKPNDQVREMRGKSCKEIYEQLKKKNETKQEKERRESSYLACRYASLGHPNQMGALIYTERIKAPLQEIIESQGWRRTPDSPAASR